MQTTPSRPQPTDVLTDILAYGYIAQTFYPSVAERYFARLLRAPPNVSPMDYYGIKYLVKGWFVTTNVQSLPVLSPMLCQPQGIQRALDLHIGSGPQELGTIVRQKLFDPTSNPIWHAQNIANAILAFPVYFQDRGQRLGFSVSDALGGTERNNYLRLRGSAGAQFIVMHLYISWPGYPAWVTRMDIPAIGHGTFPSTVPHQVAQAVDKFLELSYGRTPEDGEEMWTIGPGAITRDDVRVVGIINVALGHWQPIIQLSRSVLLPPVRKR
ncbi:hypothetical protein BC834DRAFT_973520 [Gloeopeniophorella convolvens]|nr:hypothetical protein BC834DRAFT_973520 [Gloeopeniophorella convolvens]